MSEVEPGGGGNGSAEGSLGDSSLGNHTGSSGSGITSPGPLGGGAVNMPLPSNSTPSPAGLSSVDSGVGVGGGGGLLFGSGAITVGASSSLGTTTGGSSLFGGLGGFLRSCSESTGGIIGTGAGGDGQLSSTVVSTSTPIGDATLTGSMSALLGGLRHVATVGAATAQNNNAPNCTVCYQPFMEPKVLACFHSFCRGCLERLAERDKVICPQCKAETQLASDLGVDSLLHDFGLERLQATLAESVGAEKPGMIFGTPSNSSSPGLDRHSSSPDSTNVKVPSCGGCKSAEPATAHCGECANFLCQNCVSAHQYMHCFDGHRVTQLDEMDQRCVKMLISALDGGKGGWSSSTVKCFTHRREPLQYLCFTCNILICRECTRSQDLHPHGVHQYQPIVEVAAKQLERMEQLLNEACSKQSSFADATKALQSGGQHLQRTMARAQSDIDQQYQLLLKQLEDQRRLALKELESVYNGKQVQLSLAERKVAQMMDKLQQTIVFTTRLLQYGTPTEVMVFKQLLETRLHVILNHQPDILSVLTAANEVRFVPPVNFQASRQALIQAFGVVGCSNDATLKASSMGNPPSSLGPIGRPLSRISGGPRGLVFSPPPPLDNTICTAPPGALMNGSLASHAFSDSDLLQQKQSDGPFTAYNAVSAETAFPYEKWSSGNNDAGVYIPGGGPMGPGVGQANSLMDDGIYGHHHHHNAGAAGDSHAAQVVELSGRAGGGGSSLFPPRSQIKRQKMIYHCKFGEFGVMEGQFTEPSGVCVNAHSDVIVADTNNHRIQIFDKEGRFKSQFGECGKRDGQLLYPNRVAVNRVTGDIVVTERSPTHQIQVYNQFGQFLRKFGANILQHPRGVTVDNKGRIVVIECKVMRVLIFDMYGNVLQKFSCSRYLEFPNGVCTNDRQEIFVSDNRAHCIKVFNFDGQYLRQVGGEGITNYPIGVGINHLGEVVVADNHNNFNLTIFQQDGTLVNALESKVKHAQCFDVALVDDGSVVLASKDYRLYMYRYMTMPNYAVCQ